MDKKIIYIDGWFLQPPLRGIGKYIQNILISIPKYRKDLRFILIVPNNSIELKYFSQHLEIKCIECKFSLFWYEFHLPSLLSKSPNSSIFFPAGICGIFTSYKTCNVFSTIHDVASFLPLKYNPITYSFKHILGRIYRRISFYKLIKNSLFIFTVSNTAKIGIEKISLLKSLKTPKIFIVYNASAMDEILEYKKYKNFICITGEHRQKNYKCIIEALNLLPKNSLKGWNIYLVGLKTNSEKLHKSGVNIIKKEYLSSNKIKKLYKTAYCLIFPSIFESFGIPLVDALKSKCHIIASEYGASFEVCGDSAIYFNPKSSKDLSKQILKIAYDFPNIPEIEENNIVLKQTWVKASEFIFKKIEENY